MFLLPQYFNCAQKTDCQLGAELPRVSLTIARLQRKIRKAVLGPASLYDYRQLLLQILAEVETSLVAIQSYEERLDALAGAIDQSEVAFNQSNALYREGLTSLFEVLDVQACKDFFAHDALAQYDGILEVVSFPRHKCHFKVLT